MDFKLRLQSVFDVVHILGRHHEYDRGWDLRFGEDHDKDVLSRIDTFQSRVSKSLAQLVLGTTHNGPDPGLHFINVIGELLKRGIR